MVLRVKLSSVNYALSIMSSNPVLDFLQYQDMFDYPTYLISIPLTPYHYIYFSFIPLISISHTIGSKYLLICPDYIINSMETFFKNILCLSGLLRIQYYLIMDKLNKNLLPSISQQKLFNSEVMPYWSHIGEIT